MSGARINSKRVWRQLRLLAQAYETPLCESGLDWEIFSSEDMAMTATINSRGQMVIPAKARQDARVSEGDVFEVLPKGDGRILLMRVEESAHAPRARVRLVRRNGRHTVGSTGRAITSEQVRSLLDEML